MMTGIDLLAPDTLRIERILDAPPATVWRYLTEGELRRKWFAAGSDAVAGGVVELVLDDDELSGGNVPYPVEYVQYKGARGAERVVEFDPPHVFAISWDGGKEGTAKFELFEAGPGAPGWY